MSAMITRTYEVNGRTFTYKADEEKRRNTLCQSVETAAMEERLAHTTDLRQFLALFAHLLEHYEGHRVLRPVRFSETTGNPVEWGFVDPEKPSDRVVFGDGFCRTYSLSDEIEEVLYRIGKGQPYVFEANGHWYTVHGFEWPNQDGNSKLAGVRITRAQTF